MHLHFRGPLRASDVAVRQVTDWTPALPATAMLNQGDQDRRTYNETVSLFRFQPELCSVEAGAWNMMLLIPYEEHSQQKKGDREHGYRGRKLRTILRKISPEEKEGMCQSVLCPITGKSEIQRIPMQASSSDYQ